MERTSGIADVDATGVKQATLATRFHRSFIPAPIISSPFNVTGKNR